MTTYINPGNNTGLYGIEDININVPYGNANVETFLAVGSDSGGNVVGNITAAGNIAGSYFIGDGSQLTGIAGTYANANVSAYLASGTNTANIVTTANVAGTYFIGNGSQLTGINGTYANANVSAYLASGTNSANIITTGNVSGTYVLGNGSQLTGLPATYSNAQVSSYLASGTNSANMITSGNVSGNYFLGNGSQLTGLPATYGNANVATFMGSFGSNSISTTGNVTAGFFTGDGSQLSNINAGNITGAYGNSNVSAYLASGVNTANIVTTGNISGGNIKSGNITIGTDTIKSANSTMTLDPAADGVSGVVVIAGNLQVTGTTTTVDSTVVTINDLMLNVANNAATSSAANGGGLGVGPVGSEYVKLYWDAAGNTWDSTHGISAVGTVTASDFVGSGAGLTAITGANVTGTVGNATNAVNATSATTAGTVTSASQPNITSVGTLSSVSVSGNIVTGNISAVGNIVGGNISTVGTSSAGNLSAVGNITGSNIVATTLFTGPQLITTGPSGNITGVNYIQANYFQGNGSLLTGIAITPGGTDSQIQYNDGGVLNGNALMTFNDVTGNIVLANVNIKGTQIENSTAYAVPSTAVNPGRLVIGNGYDGDISTTYDFLSRNRNAHLAVWNKNNQGNAAGQSTGLTVQQHTVATEAMINNQARAYGSSSILQIGGGAGSYPWSQTLPFAVNGQGGFVQIGNTGSATLGNTAVTCATGASGGITVGAGSSIGNAIGVIVSQGVVGTMNTSIGFSSYNTYTAGGVIGESILLYNPNGNGAYNTAQPSQFRQATNGYWFLKNDDNVAINKMGSLKQYHEFQHTLATSGTVDINKLNGQVQWLAPSANMFIGSFSNFVTSPSNGATSINQADTVTVIIQQGATGYSVGLPAAASDVKYAGGNSTVDNTANSVTMISITAINNGGTPLYLVTVSPGFV